MLGTRSWIGLVGAGILVLSGLAAADENDGAYLDPAYTDLVHPVDTDASGSFLDLDQRFMLLPQPSVTNTAHPASSDVEAMIGYQTPVKSQASRGTCSYFSTTAVLESALVHYKGYPQDVSLSEQWLAYVIQRMRSVDGSNSNPNFNALAYYGTVEQTLMPYEGAEWKTAADNATAQSRCGSVPAPFLQGCLISHYDPRLLTEDDAALKASNPGFFDIRNRARQFRTTVLAPTLDWHPGNYEVRTTGDIKSWLAQGVPLTLDIGFFYGAWNYGLADQFGIPRDPGQWANGVIGYPAAGSVDRINSPKHPAGHSVEVVGYDDNVVVQTQQRLANGTTQTFSYRGVYYIKNSWGTGGFGSKFMINGVPHPGYGMITQQYAHEQGSFYRLPVH